MDKNMYLLLHGTPEEFNNLLDALDPEEVLRYAILFWYRYISGSSFEFEEANTFQNTRGIDFFEELLEFSLGDNYKHFVDMLSPKPADAAVNSCPTPSPSNNAC